MVPFSRVLYVERDDFAEDPPKKWFRLAPGREVRLKHAYYVTCQRVVKDEETGDVLELHCTYDPASRGGWAPDGRRVKGTLHWVSAEHALPAEVRLAVAWSPAWRTRCQGADISSCATAISVWIRTRALGPLCSTAPFHCATPGPRSRRSKRASVLRRSG
jgi:hypothetical protein